MRKRFAVAALVGLLAALLALGASGAGAQVPSVPGVMSDNVQLLTTIPDVGAISGEFSTTGDFFYVSSLKGVTAYDVSDPRQPVPLGLFADTFFENEAMTYGERVVDGELRRFVVLGIDLYSLPVTDPEHAHLGFDRFHILDVTDPTSMEIIGDLETTTSTHTVQCVDQADCDYAYTAGHGGEFEIIDLTKLFTEPAPDNLSVLKKVQSPAAGPSAIFSGGAGHYWDFDDADVGWHTGSGGAAAFDVSDPTNPVPIQATNQQGVKTPYNDFILHNSQRPNAAAFKANADPKIDNGNVLLVTEEDYFNDGNEVECEQTTGTEAGTFQTWHIPNLNGEAYREANPDGKSSRGTIAPLDIVNAPAEFGNNSPLTAPVAAFCSGHWFDHHPDNVVAQGYYQQGLWLEDVSDPANIKYYGYFTPRATEVWDAYWVPKRNGAGEITGKTNLVYTVDAVRGIDVLEIDLPSTGGGPAPNVDDRVDDPGQDPDDGVGNEDDDRNIDDGVGDDDDARLPATGGGLGLLLLGAAALPAAAYIGRRRR